MSNRIRLSWVVSGAVFLIGMLLVTTSLLKGDGLPVFPGIMALGGATNLIVELVKHFQRDA